MALLRRPEMDYPTLMQLPGGGPGPADPRIREQLVIEARYAGYLKRQTDQVARSERSEHLPIPQDLDYRSVAGLSAEVREKLLSHRPATLGQAARIPGITPAAVSLLLVHLRRDTERRSA